MHVIVMISIVRLHFVEFESCHYVAEKGDITHSKRPMINSEVVLRSVMIMKDETMSSKKGSGLNPIVQQVAGIPQAVSRMVEPPKSLAQC